MISFLQEVGHSLSNNKLRTGLTAFSIAWGILLLILLLGSGRGIQEGIRRSTKEVGVFQGIEVNLYKTNKPYGGYQEGRQLRLNERQLESVRIKFGHLFPVMSPSLIVADEARTVEYEGSMGTQTLTSELQASGVEHVVRGRLFTDKEHREGSKVIVISEKVLPDLFPKGNNPIGEVVLISGVSYTVVGVKRETNAQDPTSLIPYNAAKQVYSAQMGEIQVLRLVPHASLSIKETNVHLKELEQYLRGMLHVDPTDEWAMWIRSHSDTDESLEKVFRGIDILLWVIGLASLGIGVVGVSNIMQVTVQERMREIGIRKALGAKPLNIMSLVLGESVLISVVSGVVGFVVGYGLLDLLAFLTDKYDWGRKEIPSGDGSELIVLEIFSNPHVDYSIALGALIVLIVAGIMAGYAPARKAIRIPAVEAMRDMK